ncbi:DUF4259 domain-containing protein [Dactylosporangium sp. CS-047395]|uniref:DUF4259 domain-containing protein n=1 Tax=Dactylosporangium sp. CS-047395 TaxID=3239936 RepID=UPI003D94B29B
MGFWDVSPFGNDGAADFAYDLDEATTEARIKLIGDVLEGVATTDEPEIWDAPRAVAAAALVPAQCPGGHPIRSGHGPLTPMPAFPGYCRELAIEALDRIVAPPSWLADFWADASERAAWRRTVADLRKVLDPPQAEVLFDLESDPRTGQGPLPMIGNGP